jgi:hypothetical protein
MRKGRGDAAGGGDDAEIASGGFEVEYGAYGLRGAVDLAAWGVRRVEEAEAAVEARLPSTV